jgi:leader peptidase (prepilin peptidase)/N-methyltransferase
MEITMTSILIWNSVYDWKYKKISMTSIIFGFILAGIICKCTGDYIWTDSLAGAAVGVFVILCSVITRGQIGIGDGIVFCLTGIGCGLLENISLLFISLLFAAVLSLVLLLSKKAGKKTRIPFVPLITMGYLCIQLLKVV